MKARTIKKHDHRRAKKKLELMEQAMPALRKRNRELEEASYQTKRMVDAILISAAMEYGVKETEGEDVLGYRLELPDEKVEEVLGKYVLKAEKRDGKMVLAAMPKNS